MKTEILTGERDRATEALRESEERYKRLLAATTAYTYTVDLEQGQTRSTYHGPGCKAVTGYSPDDYDKDPYLWYRIIHEDDRPAVLRQVDKILQGKQPPPLEHRIIHRDGSLRWIRNTTIPHYSVGGRLIGYDGLIADITERKLSEEALEHEHNLLRESQERLALVIRGSNDGIWDWNIVTGEAFFSPRWKNMLGYDDAEIENRMSSWEELIHPDDRDLAKERVRSYLAGEISTYELEHRLRHKNGSYRWILARGVMSCDPSGRPVRMSGSHMDLTELKNAIEEAKQAHRELLETQDQLIWAQVFESIGTLAAGVAHEVKNPLQTILMGVSFLERKLQNQDEAVSTALKDMEESVARADSIISHLLSLAHVDDFQFKSGDLNPIIRQCLHLTKAKLHAASITTVLNLGVDLPMVQLDVLKVEQVFLNLFLNAIHAMPSGGSLTVMTRTMTLADNPSAIPPMLGKFSPGQRLVIAEIRDTGTGICDNILPRVFEPFFTTKPAGVGTGLGLYTARMIMDRHGGVIALNNAPGGGALATVALRVEQEGCP